MNQLTPSECLSCHQLIGWTGLCSKCERERKELNEQIRRDAEEDQRRKDSLVRD